MNRYTKLFVMSNGIFPILLTALFILLSFLPASAGIRKLPEKTISGKVTDSTTGKPLALVSITVKGKQAAATSQDGTYSINADDNDVLVFSYVGYSNAEVKVGTQTTIDVVMAATSGALHDVVVTALGITKQRRALGIR